MLCRARAPDFSSPRNRCSRPGPRRSRTAPNRSCPALALPLADTLRRSSGPRQRRRLPRQRTPPALSSRPRIRARRKRHRGSGWTLGSLAPSQAPSATATQRGSQSGMRTGRPIGRNPASPSPSQSRGRGRRRGTSATGPASSLSIRARPGPLAPAQRRRPGKRAGSCSGPRGRGRAVLERKAIAADGLEGRRRPSQTRGFRPLPDGGRRQRHASSTCTPAGSRCEGILHRPPPILSPAWR